MPEPNLDHLTSGAVEPVFDMCRIIVEEDLDANVWADERDQTSAHQWAHALMVRLRAVKRGGGQ